MVAKKGMRTPHQKRICKQCRKKKSIRSYNPRSETVCDLCRNHDGVYPSDKKDYRAKKREAKRECADSTCVREFVQMSATERGNLIALLQLLHDKL